MVGITIGVDSAVKVSVNLGQDVGGPSAGLMFSLGIYDKLTPQNITGGRFIAGTGTISPEGEVGPIGGIQQKMVAAKDAGATVFLSPTRTARRRRTPRRRGCGWSGSTPCTARSALNAPGQGTGRPGLPEVAPQVSVDASASARPAQIGSEQHLIVAVVAAQPHRRVREPSRGTDRRPAYVLAAGLAGRLGPPGVASSPLPRCSRMRSTTSAQPADLFRPFDCAQDILDRLLRRQVELFELPASAGRAFGTPSGAGASSGSCSCSSGASTSGVQSRGGVPAGASRRGVRGRGRAVRVGVIRSLFFHQVLSRAI